MAASDKSVSITITAKDGTSQTFRAIAQEATTMGQAITRGSASAGTAIDATNTKARDLAAAMQKLHQDASAFGQMLGQTVVFGLQAVAAAGVASQRAIDQLAQAVTDAGQNYNEYKTAIDSATAAGQQYGLSATTVTGALQTLVSVTQDTAASINLIGLAENIAAAKHIDLASAAQLVGRVYDGNVGILKRYGIVLDAGTTSTEALAILQQRYNGQAEAGATTLSRYTAEVTNWAAAAGRAIGPFSGLIQVLPGLSAGFQLAEAGGKLVIDMFRTQQLVAEGAAVALQAETAAAAEAAAAGEAATIAEAGIAGGLLGPIGIVAALGAAAAAFLFFKHSTDDSAKSAQEATAAYAALAGSVSDLAAAGSPNASAAKGALDIVNQITAESNAIADNVAAVKKLNDDMTNIGVANISDQTIADDKARLAQTQALVLALRAAGNEIEGLSNQQQIDIDKALGGLFSHDNINATAATAAFQALVDQFRAGTLSAAGFDSAVQDLNTNWYKFATSVADADPALTALNTQIASLQKLATKDWQDAVWNTLDVKPIQDVINTIFSSFDPSAAGFQTGISTILKGIADGTISAADGYKYIIALGGQFNDILTAEAAAAESASQANADMNAVLDQQAIAAGGTADALDKLSKAQQGKQDTPFDDRTLGGLIAEKQAAEAAAVALTHLSSLGPARVIDPTSGQSGKSGSFALDTIGRATGNVTQETDLLATAQSHLAASFAQSYDAAIKTAAGYVQASGGLTSYLDALQHSTGNSRVVQVASDLSDVNARLATMTEVVIGNTDAIGKSSQQLDDWATKLIAPVGTLAEIDDLLAKGAISQSTYNAAQEAGTRIFADNARVQQDVQVIQAKEAPLLADLADKQAQYMDQLAKQPAQAQLAALGWMDLGEQQKAQAIIALASSATTSQAAQDIINSATATDPALEAMLEQLGVIGKDHKVTLKEDGFKEVSDSVDKLTDSMKVLITLLTPEGKITLDSGLAQANVDAINKALGDVPPDTSATVTAYVFGASDVAELATEIGNLYDRNIYVTTFTNTVDLGRNATPGSMLGGVIQRHAAGGVASWLAEAGPEFLDFPNGGHGMAYSKGVYSVPEGTYVHTAPATKAMGAGGGPSRQYIHNGNVYHYPSSGASARDAAMADIAWERR